MKFLNRFPFALLGAIGLLSLGSDVIEFEKHVAAWIHIWQSVTYPVWEFLFGWMFDWVDWKFPGWMKDYLTVGVICTGGVLRIIGSSFFYIDEPKSKAIMLYLYLLLIIIIFWPFITMVILLYGTVSYCAIRHPKRNKPVEPKGDIEISISFISHAFTIYVESFIYALIIIATSYAFIFSGVSSPAAS